MQIKTISEVFKVQVLQKLASLFQPHFGGGVQFYSRKTFLLRHEANFNLLRREF